MLHFLKGQAIELTGLQIKQCNCIVQMFANKTNMCKNKINVNAQYCLKNQFSRCTYLLKA